MVAIPVIYMVMWAIGMAVYDPTPPPDVPAFGPGEAITVIREWVVWCDNKMPAWSQRRGECAHEIKLTEEKHKWASAYLGDGTWVVKLGDYRWEVYESFRGVVASRVPFACHYDY